MFAIFALFLNLNKVTKYTCILMKFEMNNKS